MQPSVKMSSVTVGAEEVIYTWKKGNYGIQSEKRLLTAFLSQQSTLSLWEGAFDELSTEDQEQLDFSCDGPYPSPSSVLSSVSEKRDECIRKQWVLYTSKNGEKLMVRDLFNSISTWIDQFKRLGDAAIQYDPGHAALPWAAVRFFLQVNVS